MTVTIHAERSTTLVRGLKAPRDLVWKAWTDTAMLKEWWGPEQFTNTRVEGDIREGGELHLTMHGPKGTPFDIDFPMVNRYRKIVPGKKLVFENEPLGPRGERLIEGLTTVTFADHPHGTLLEVTTSGKALAPEAVNMLKGMDQGWSQVWTNLPALWGNDAMGLEHLERLVGRWSIQGEAQGQTRWRWAEGKRFLLQDFDIVQNGRHHKGLEVIGHLQRLNEEPTVEIWSRAYHFTSGLTLDYVYEMEGDQLTIWFRHKGSDNRMRGRFSPDGASYDARWEWPGGGYRVQGKRLD